MCKATLWTIQRVAKKPDLFRSPVQQNYGVVVVLVVVPVVVVAPVVVVVVSEVPPHAVKEATSAKLAAARAMV